MTILSVQQKTEHLKVQLVLAMTTNAFHLFREVESQEVA